MAADLALAVVLGILICGSACALVGVIFWQLWRRKDTTGSFYMAARRSTMLLDSSFPLVESWKNGSEPALQQHQHEPARLLKETRSSGSQAQTSSQKTHSRNTSSQSSHRPSMSVHPSGRRAVDQLRNMEIADPSGILTPHELEACMPSELDGESSLPKPSSWTGRTLNSEMNSPSFMRKASLRTRRAEKQSRNSGFFVPRPSSLGMRKLGRAEVDAELAAVRASSEDEGVEERQHRTHDPSSAATVSPMNTASMKPGSSSNFNTPLRTAVSHDSMELDAESPRRRASFSSWRKSAFDVVPSSAKRNVRNSSLGPEWCPRSDSHAYSYYPQPNNDENNNNTDPHRPSELSGESIMQRSSIWVERESFPPRMTRSLEIPRNSYQPYQRPVVVMNSPTESSAYDRTDDEDDSSDYDSDDEETDNEDDDDDGSSTPVDSNAPWCLPPMNLYSPALGPQTRERWISPMTSPAVFSSPNNNNNNSGRDSPSSPASTPRHNKVSPLPSPYLYNNSKTQKQNQASGELLAPMTYIPGGKEGKERKDSSNTTEVHYPSWSEISGFDFVKKGASGAGNGAGASGGEGGEEGDDGWRPVPDSATGRYELAT